MATFRDVKKRSSILRAIRECDSTGRTEFLKRHGFELAKTYEVAYGGRRYDSKAILGVAHGYEFPDEGTLSAEDLSGGKTGAASHVARLGFEVDGIDKPSGWSIEEIQPTVEAYFEMLRMHLRGQTFNKAEFRSSVMASMKAANGDSRSEGAIGRKFHNISAILDELGMPWISGYKPLSAYQLLLRSVVIDYLEEDLSEPLATKLDERADFVVAPTLAPKEGGKSGKRQPRNTNFAAIDAMKRDLGNAGERFVVEFEMARLRQRGKPELAEKVEHVSTTQGDGLGYDICSFDEDGGAIFIEVKTTNRGKNTPFEISASEVDASKAVDGFVLYRVFDFSSMPKIYRLIGNIEESCQLVPTGYSARPMKRI